MMRRTGPWLIFAAAAFAAGFAIAQTLQTGREPQFDNAEVLRELDSLT